jgi:hypothetical protein
VLKAHEGPGKTAYAVDVRVVRAGTLEDTERVISEVPLSPLWVSKKKRGVYAIPPVDSVVIVEFLEWNPAFPYIAGVWSDEYEADEFGVEKFVITNGDGMKMTIDASERAITLDNGEGCVLKLEKNQKCTLDNGRCQAVLNGDRIALKSGSQSLYTILDSFLQNLMGLKTVGSPANHNISPDTIQ